MDFNSIDLETPYEDLITSNEDNGIAPQIPDQDRDFPDAEDNIDFKQLSSDIKIEILLPDGTVVPGPILNADQEVNTSEIPNSVIKGVQDTIAGEISDTANTDPAYVGIPQSFLVHKRIPGTVHSETLGKRYIGILRRRIAPPIEDPKKSRAEVIIRLNELNKLAGNESIQTRYGKLVSAPSMKKYTKEERIALSEAKQVQRELDFAQEQTYDEEDEEYLAQNPELRERLATANKIKFVKAGGANTIVKRIKIEKYKELALSNSLVIPQPIPETLPYKLPEYVPLTLENGLIIGFNESDIEFKFRSYWTQIALQIGAGNISIGTAVALGKMKVQKLIYNASFHPEMEKIIQTVDEVYLLNAEGLIL
jgi:hypothetical protein